MKGFKKIEGVGQIPEHWGAVKLKYLAKKIKSGGTPSTHMPKFYASTKENGYLWVAIEDMKSSTITDTKRYITQEGLKASSAHLVPPFSVLYAIYGASLGKVAYTDKTLTTNQGILAIQPNNKCFYKFLFYYFCAIEPNIKSLSTITTQNNLSLNIVKNLKIPLPPLEEQHAIAAFLEDKTAKIQECITKKTRMLELLKQYKQALIAQMTTKGLDPQARLKPSGVAWLGDIPEGWGVKKIKYVCQVNPKARAKLPDEFTYIDLESVKSGALLKEQRMQKAKAPSRAQRLLKRGDILYQRVRPYQKNNFFFDREGDYVASTGYAQLRTQQNPKFIYYALHEESFVNEVVHKCTGTGYPEISNNDLKDLFIPLPPLPEQHAIAAFLEEKTTKIDRLRTKLQAQIQALKDYKSALISAGVLGQIPLKDKHEKIH
ncbi:restriction endonuclease subunit S [Helicobacter labacensis]|uniref:restriction endonuclease subunit S n=1 Tax=Helicobacter labacensis TaxID=2316079 RepID=UPI000EB4173E|nr:restriction endonuclease subunit S [Helicobacter labacensis]